MLTQFNVKNYKSIAEELTIDFTAMKGLRDNAHFVIDCDGQKVLPVAALFGNNASGKTNILDALVRMFLFVYRTEISRDQDIPLQTTPYLFQSEKAKEPTDFEIFFVHDKREYQYGFSVLNDEFSAEWLHMRKLSEKTKTVWKVLLERKGDDFSFGTVKRNRFLSNYVPMIDKKLLALEFLAQRNLEETREYSIVYEQFGMIQALTPQRNVDSMNTSLYFQSPSTLEETTQFIQQFDSMFEGLTLEAYVNADGKEQQELRSLHKGKSYPLSFESDGTQKLIVFFQLFSFVLKWGGVLIVDELDCQLHPLIMRKIVKTFHDKNENKNNAQLVFSSHNLIVLDRHDLRRDEIWFVEKDSSGKTTASSMGEFIFDNNRFRADSDYSKHYLAGRFGAIPFQNSRIGE